MLLQFGDHTNWTQLFRFMWNKIKGELTGNVWHNCDLVKMEKKALTGTGLFVWNLFVWFSVQLTHKKNIDEKIIHGPTFGSRFKMFYCISCIILCASGLIMVRVLSLQSVIITKKSFLYDFHTNRFYGYLCRLGCSTLLH